MTATALDNLFRLEGQHAMVTIGDTSLDFEVVEAKRGWLRRDGHNFFPDMQTLADVQPVMA